MEGGQNKQQALYWRQESLPVSFFKFCRELVEEKCAEGWHKDMIATVIYAALFTAAIVAFVVHDLHPQPELGANQEAVTLLCDLAYKMGHTAAICDDVPVDPQEIGRLFAIYQARAILYASITVSLLSNFISTIGKQWWKRCASADVGVSVIDYDLNWRREPDGLVALRFYPAMQLTLFTRLAALFLWTCGTLRHLWVTGVVLVWSVPVLVLFLFVVISSLAEALWGPF